MGHGALRKTGIVKPTTHKTPLEAFLAAMAAAARPRVSTLPLILVNPPPFITSNSIKGFRVVVVKDNGPLTGFLRALNAKSGWTMFGPNVLISRM